MAILSDLTLSAIQAEATRAHLRHGYNSSMFNAQYGDRQRLAILTEEVGEVAHELNELVLGNLSRQKYRENLEKELIQVAAMAATWIEAMND
jgi:NTP pyrophosphatase (non-canonical NTP hydrolase)